MYRLDFYLQITCTSKYSSSTSSRTTSSTPAFGSRFYMFSECRLCWWNCSIMNVRETRLATLIAHILILISTYTLLPYPLRWIPTSVLHGLFLYMALTSLAGNEMFERLLLLITEQVFLFYHLKDFQAAPCWEYFALVNKIKEKMLQKTCQRQEVGGGREEATNFNVFFTGCGGSSYQLIPPSLVLFFHVVL